MAERGNTSTTDIKQKGHQQTGESTMKKAVICLHCDRKMNLIRTEKLQLGQTGWILGDLPNLLAGAMDVDIYSCPSCRKLEFYQGDGEADQQASSGIAQKICPKCGLEHDLDDPRCPRCKFHYYR